MQAGWTTQNRARELCANVFVNSRSYTYTHTLFSALLEVLSLLRSDTEERYTHCGWIRCNPLLKTWFHYRCFVPDLCIPDMPEIP